MFCFVFVFKCTSLLFWHCKKLHILYCISCLSPKISHFSRETWLLLLVSGIRIQDLGSRCACCCEVVAKQVFSSSHFTEAELGSQITVLVKEEGGSSGVPAWSLRPCVCSLSLDRFFFLAVTFCEVAYFPRDFDEAFI